MRGYTGNGISNITKTGTSGLVDTYTITYTNGNTTTFTVTNGKGISSIVKTGSAGLVDTYRITYNDGTYFDYTVTNGQDGEVTEEELEDVFEQMSSELEDNTATETSIDTTGGAYWRAKLGLSGNTEQSTNIITYTCDGTETGDYYFVYNSTNYQFTMPTISSGDVIYFNTDTLKLYLSTTEIATTTASTGTLITMKNTPNPNYPQDIQVVKGSNNVKIYNKNALNISNSTINKNGFIVKIENNHITITSTGTNSTINLNSLTNISELNNKFSNKQITFSIKNLVNTGSNIIHPSQIYFSSSNNSYYLQPHNDTNTVTKTLISKLTTLSLYLPAGTYNSSFDLQFEEGSTSTSYIAHQEQNYPITLPTGMELCNIGNYSDEIILKSDGWYKKARIGKCVLNGGSFAGYMSGGILVMPTEYNSIFGQHLINGNFSKAICNRRQIQMDNFPAPNKTLYISVAGDQMSLYDENLTTKELWTQYFEENPHIIYGILSTPVETQITDTTLINQLNDIYNKLKTYQGISHITQTNEDMPFILTLDYKKSNLLRIKALENA